ncbi:hypothetical protein GCM10010271_39470 [Streptomyces kurssanovii]|nr:hypothetical protein GCM10010271_39470 [Streptomyces kurssanovii]
MGGRGSVAELAANAVALACAGPGLRVAPHSYAADAADRGLGHARRAPAAVPAPLAESGRGLLLVEALTDRWVVLDRVPVGKTVRVELDLHGAAAP